MSVPALLALRNATGGRSVSIGSIAFRVCSRLLEKLRSALKSLS
jgi:hypothetical protein